MELRQLHEQLFTWWREHGRVLPWREKIASKKNTASLSLREETFSTYFTSSLRRDPYHVVVSELMLQQTQVDRVLPKYEAWMQKWPTITDLAHATLPDVLIFWQGLGYNRRARYLSLLAKEIEKRGGTWPKIEKDLLSLPGIGPYTARAILSFSMDQHVGVVDTNVQRILSRVLGTEKDFFAVADSILPSGQSDPWNQALMDFGALVCTAKSPKCGECPVQNLCQANLAAQKNGFLNFAESIPKKVPKTKKTIRFEETDRYFRGRIIDELRVSGMNMKELQEVVEQKYGLQDEQRFQILLARLESDGLIINKNARIDLAQ